MPDINYESLVKETYPDAHHVLDLVSGYVFIRAMSPNRMFEMNIGEYRHCSHYARGVGTGICSFTTIP